MLRSSCTFLGRWTSRDFLKGRGKCAGAVHIRSTLGSRGRAKRLGANRNIGYRDGLPHDHNQMSGILGVKLGSGLFGPRGPMGVAGQLDESDLEIVKHGNPNITNTYKGMLDQHPNMAEVIAGPKATRAFAAFPLDMWDMNSSVMMKQQQQQQPLFTSATNDNDTVVTNNNTDGNKRSSSFFLNPAGARRFRLAERRFVVHEATRFLLMGGGGIDNSNKWRERCVVIGNSKKSAVLSMSDLEREFASSLLQEKQQDGMMSKEGGEEKNKTINDSLEEFVRSRVVEACRGCASFLFRHYQQHRQQPPQQESATATIVQNESFLNTLLQQAPHSLRVVLSCKSDDDDLVDENDSNNKKRQQQPQQPRSTTNEIVKWYMRAQDPRAHISGGGHSQRQFSLVCVCPFVPLQPRVMKQLTRSGFMMVNAGVSTPSQMMSEVAKIVVDDSERRTAVEKDNDHHHHGDDGDGVVAEFSGSSFSARDSADWRAAEQDIPGNNMEQFLPAHLIRGVRLRSEKRLVKNNRDDLPLHEYAKSYFAPG